MSITVKKERIQSKIISSSILHRKRCRFLKTHNYFEKLWYSFAEVIPFFPLVIIRNLYEEVCLCISRKQEPIHILPQNLLQKKQVLYFRLSANTLIKYLHSLLFDICTVLLFMQQVERKLLGHINLFVFEAGSYKLGIQRSSTLVHLR